MISSEEISRRMKKTSSSSSMPFSATGTYHNLLETTEPAPPPFNYQYQSLIICRWSLIAGRLPGRTDNEIKHYWNSHLRRKLASMGIDPNNHRVNQYCTMQWCSSRNNCKLKGQFKHPGDDDSLSDTASCVKDDQTCSRRVVPDLNLDLIISSPRDRVAAGEQEDMISSPTLVLFR